MIHSIRIACEDPYNPVCEMFQLLSKTNDEYEMILSVDLLTTLQAITCCDEMVFQIERKTC